MALCLCLALGVLPASAVAGTSAQGETALDQALNGEEGLLSFTTSEDHPWTVMQDQAETERMRSLAIPALPGPPQRS